MLSFEDENHYADKEIVGGVYPITGTAGTMELRWPMPFAETGPCPPTSFTDSGGIFAYQDGALTATRLRGQFVAIRNFCPGNGFNAFPGPIDLAGVNGDTDCDPGVAPGGSPDNTPAARTAFYELNRIAELARGWLPANPWLQGRLQARVNRKAPVCFSYWTPFPQRVNFSLSDSLTCRNPGEIASIVDHEWGHGLDDNDANLVLSNPSEAYADIAAIYRLHASCIGDGFRTPSTPGSCGVSSTGDTFANEAPPSKPPHCDLACTGFRDADWRKHDPKIADTPSNFVCPVCDPGPGPCGREVHCAAAPIRQAAWDLVAHYLPAAGLSPESSFILGNKLFYEGSGNIGLWYNCDCTAVSSNGCGATNGYLQWLAADDDDGNLNNGTPHMTAIFNAFDSHGIACPSPTPQDSGCGGAPTTVPSLSATAGPGTSVSLTWGAIAGASSYWVFRTDGADCDFGKALIAKVVGTSYVDNDVGAGRHYYYNVVAVGSASQCFSQASNCEDVMTSSLPLMPAACRVVGERCFSNSDCCSSTTSGCSGGKPCTRVCI